VFKGVRVFLSLQVGNFLSGIGQARRAFSGFVSAVQGGVRAALGFFADLNQVVELVGRAIRGLGSAFDWVNRTFLEGAMAQERFLITLDAITGSAEQAAEMNEYLRQKARDLGISYEKATQYGQQMASALRGANGEVDIDLWKQYTDIITQFSALRTDVPIELWGRAVSEFMSGNPQTLTRLLDINVKSLENLNDETKKFLEGGTEAQSQQLGQVTELGARASATGDDAIAALADVANAVGATEELVEKQAESSEALIERVKQRWKDFTDEVGDTFLPHLESALEGFIEFLDEHQEEIDAFAEALGKFAGEKFEQFANWLLEQDWEKVGQDIARLAKEGFGTLKEFVEGDDFQNALKAIKDMVASISTGDAPFLDAIKEVDWETVAEALNTMANVIQFIAEHGELAGSMFGVGVESLSPNPDPGSFIGLGLDAFQAGKDLASQSQQNQEAQQQTPSQGPQEVTVRVIVDGEQNIRAAVDNAARAAASEEIGAFTDEVVRSTGAGH
jgi:hypothetical protein